MDNVGLRNKLFSKGLSLLFMLAMMLVAGAATLVFAEKASAHGYIESPASRSYLCKTGQNTGCGQIQWEPQSVEGIGSFPQSGPSDGEFTGAGRYPELYAQTADRWTKVTLQGGQNAFTWNLTAPHSTAEWKYYITKKDWNPNKPLARADLELFCSFQDGGKRPPFTVTQSCNVPTDRSGYHIILAVWEIADTGMAFYQAIDVNLINTGTGIIEKPTVPGNVTSVSQTATSIELSWTKSVASEGIKQYDVYRDGSHVGTVEKPSFVDKGLTAGTSYTYTIKAVDAAGNISEESVPFAASTKEKKPEAPGEIADWDSSAVYVQGDRVLYNGLEFVAKWWTKGEEPGKADVWKLVE
ncbi:lytic polysaccharide monooxygenase [Brevibacillus formosus]|uniref:lytic polysaccharide monooxygenase n=1 Tax=Brevibacillus formosus TaxID=54913 RepID=UPI003F1BC7C7